MVSLNYIANACVVRVGDTGPPKSGILLRTGTTVIPYFSMGVCRFNMSGTHASLIRVYQSIAWPLAIRGYRFRAKRNTKGITKKTG